MHSKLYNSIKREKNKADFFYLFYTSTYKQTNHTKLLSL